MGITGTDFGDFADTTTCSSSLGQGQSCAITVTFTPQATGNKWHASADVGDNGGGNPAEGGTPRRRNVEGGGVPPSPKMQQDSQLQRRIRVSISLDKQKSVVLCLCKVTGEGGYDKQTSERAESRMGCRHSGWAGTSFAGITTIAAKAIQGGRHAE